MFVQASILIPVFNEREIFLEQCILSAVGQTCKNIEVIISDNHSDSSGTKEVIRRLVSKFPWLKVVSPPSHVSMLENFRHVLQHAQGEWVSFLCSDDYLEPSFIQESLVAIADCPMPPAFSYCLTRFYSEDHSSIVSHVKSRQPGWASRDHSLRRFLTGKEGSFCGLLMRKNLLKAFDPFPTAINYCADLYIEVCMSRYAGTCFIDKSLAVCRLHKRAEQDRRLPRYVRDIRIIYEMFESDPVLNLLVSSSYIRKQRYLLLGSSLYSYYYHSRMKSLPPRLLDEAKSEIGHLDTSFLTSLILSSCNRFMFSLLMRIRALASLCPSICF
jgi:glycosyltransferase involved in cell wall biosynthesis